jgi:hydrogenase nickel incorporation protein HypA/HybF
MHELPFTESILAIVLEEAKGVQADKVTQIDVTIGKLSGILPACVQFAFDVLSRKTLLEGARLTFHEPAGQVRCRNCSITFASQGFDDLTCPGCSQKKIEVLSGREFTVDSIEWE